MTIQEMFNLLILYKKAVCIVNEHKDTTLTPELKACIEKEYKLMLEAESYIPKFSPMDCKHCIHKNCNRKRDNKVCEEYEVESIITDILYETMDRI